VNDHVVASGEVGVDGIISNLGKVRVFLYLSSNCENIRWLINNNNIIILVNNSKILKLKKNKSVRIISW
jgi:hypothetical protein